MQNLGRVLSHSVRRTNHVHTDRPLLGMALVDYMTVSIERLLVVKLKVADIKLFIFIHIIQYVLNCMHFYGVCMPCIVCVYVC